MPQPLSSLKGFGGCYYGDTTLIHRPEHSFAAFKIIRAAMSCEQHVGYVLVCLVPENAPALALHYASLENDSKKMAVIEAIGCATLAPEKLNTLRAIIKLHVTASKLRNPLVHWRYGYCEGIYDALLTLNTRDEILRVGWAAKRYAALAKYGRGHAEFKEAEDHMLDCMPTPRRTLAYTLKELQQIEAQLRRVEYFLTEFSHAIGKGDQPPEERSDRYQKLIECPEVKAQKLQILASPSFPPRG